MLKTFYEIATYVIDQGPYDGSTKDVFDMALSAYEDNFGEVTDEEADKFNHVFREILKNDKEDAKKSLAEKAFRRHAVGEFWKLMEKKETA
jgi:hypothetical protein|tara:strand:+ start:757 stop:1029 length:273 start_codon:yes stop_codon:yes gene_type:complete